MVVHDSTVNNQLLAVQLPILTNIICTLSVIKLTIRIEVIMNQTQLTAQEIRQATEKEMKGWL